LELRPLNVVADPFPAHLRRGGALAPLAARAELAAAAALLEALEGTYRARRGT